MPIAGRAFSCHTVALWADRNPLTGIFSCSSRGLLFYSFATKQIEFIAGLDRPFFVRLSISPIGVGSPSPVASDTGTAASDVMLLESTSVNQNSRLSMRLLIGNVPSSSNRYLVLWQRSSPASGRPAKR